MDPIAAVADPTSTDPVATFRALHQRGTFLLPNPWDIGSARLLQALGFKALATTSGGFANSLGRLDQNVTADEVFRHVEALTAAITLPLSVDFEDGYANTPEGIARNIDRLASCGAAGVSIEDYMADQHAPYPIELAVERVLAAVEASRASGMVVTARAENHLYGSGPLTDTIERLCAYRDAGADCLYAPGLNDRNDIVQVVNEVGAPINVLARPAGPSVSELREIGVRRISVGSALARNSYAALVEAAEELLDDGTCSFAENRIEPSIVSLAFDLEPLPGTRTTAPDGVAIEVIEDSTDVLSPNTTDGGCACRRVRYRIDGELRDVWYCHCVDCRHVSGHHVAATGVNVSGVTIEGTQSLRWFSRQPGIEYGFCSDCGSSLFWRSADKPHHLSIMAGSLDSTDGLTLGGELFTDERGSYITDDAPVERFPGDWPPAES